MESSGIARYIPQKSKRRVFPGTSSSCMEPEVVEISPPDDRTSKSKAKALKQKEVVFHEIIDVDMDEDRNDVVFVEGKLESNKKAKGTMGLSMGPSSAVQLDSMDRVHSTKKIESNKKGKDVAIMSSAPSSASQLDSVNRGHSSKKSFAPGSDNFFDLDGAGSDLYTTDVFADDYVFEDDYLTVQSYFDKMDLPSGIEAPISWLPDAVQMKSRTSANCLARSAAPAHARTHFSSMAGPTLHTQLESGNHLHRVEPPPLWPSTRPARSMKNSAVWSGSTYSSLQAQSDPMNVPSVETPLKVQHGNMPSFVYDQLFGTGTSSSFSQLPMDTAYPLGVDTSYSKWHSSEAIMKDYLELGDAYSIVVSTPEPAHIYPTEDILVDQDAGKSQRHSSVVGSSSNMAGLENEDVLKRYENFKKFDTVLDHSDHYYSTQSSATKQPPKNWAKKIQEEWRILEKDLPDTIFVRVYESRMDLLRAVIIGAEGTPYHDGLFFFDVCFPSSYPNVPPLVHYHAGGLRINPNLYKCGKVCLSLLNTWTGGQKERWVPGVSTMLQVLVSIQGLILNTKPYFNEPGFANSSGSVHGEQCSLQYNENTLILSLKTMVYTMKKPPKNFEDLVIGHFRNRVRDILMACKAYTEGVQVGCLVKGGVQDVDEGDKSCSPKFKNDVASYIKTLVGSFKKIGAKEAEEFLSLSEKISPLPAPTPPPAHPHAYGQFPSTAIADYNLHYW